MTTWLRRSPFSIGLTVLVVVLSILDRSLFRPGETGPHVLPRLADHEPTMLLPLLMGVVVARGLPDLLVAVAGLLLLVAPIEARLLGTRRTVVAYLLTSLIGVGGGVGLQSLGLLTRDLWTTPPDGAPAAGAFVPIFGIVLTASAFAGPLWRRRMRLIGLSSATVVLLYSGQPGDLYRLVGAFAGLVLGMLLARRRPRLQWPRSSHHEVRSLVASLVAVSAGGPFVALVAPRGYGLLRPLGLLFRDTLPTRGGLPEACRRLHPPDSCIHDLALTRLNGPGAVLLTVLPLLVLVIAALAMWRGRRVGAMTAVAVNLFLAALAAVYYGYLPSVFDPDQLADQGNREAPTLQAVLAVLVPIAVAVTVMLTRRHFDVRPSRFAQRTTLIVIGTALAGTAVPYVAVGYLLRRQFSPVVDLSDLLGDVVERYVPVGFLRLRRIDFVPRAMPAALLYDWVGPLFWLTLLLAVAWCSFSVRSQATGSDLARIRQLLLAGSEGSLGWMTTWPGSRYWFTADGRHGVAYREENGVAIALGAPVGAHDGVLEAARAFAVFCDDAGLTPVFYAVHPDFAAALGQGRAWPTVVIAEDTVLDPATFRMTGKRWQDVRSSFNRADRAGVRAVWTDWEQAPLALRSQVLSISEEWVAEKRLPELGFTLGGVDELRDAEVKLMLAVGSDDRLDAVTSWLPTYRSGEVIGWTLDFMRRRPHGMNGVMEFLIASVALSAQQRGLEFVSLSAAPLAVSAGEDPDSPLDRALAALARILEPAYGFTSLASFKEKFDPRLQPLVLAYPDAIALPAIGVAVARAYLPDLSLPDFVRLAGALR